VNHLASRRRRARGGNGTWQQGEEMEDEVLPKMTLDEFIGHLLAIRDERGGDVLVVMSDYKPVVPPRFMLCESFMGDEPPQPYVIITDHLEQEEGDD
jgi:hypothetical protein